MGKEKIRQESSDLKNIDLAEKNIEEENLGGKDNLLERAKKIINETKEKIKEGKEKNKKSYEDLQNNLRNFLFSIEGVKAVYKVDQTVSFKQELYPPLREIEEIQKEINSLVNELEEKINSLESRLNKHPSPEEIKSRLEIRDANQEEQERFADRIPSGQKEALKVCSRIFNKCQYPWYLTGSIAFLINATESQKQPDDIDIIFHEEDFEQMAQEFKALGFETGIAKNTGCPFIRGKIEVQIENGETKEIEVEAFGQKTEEPNGLINPGAKDTKYEVIKNKVSDNEEENFNILNKSGQVELYFKNLISEIKHFNFESFLQENSETANENKAKKFINRLANLFELSGNNKLEILRKTRELCKNEEEFLLLRSFVDISKKFREERYQGKGLEYVYDDGHLQVSIENLKREIGREQEVLQKSYLEISDKMKKIESMTEEEKLKLIEKIEEEIYSKKDMLDHFLKSHQEINSENDSREDLPIYIFISKFKDSFITPFCEKMLIFKQELSK